MKIFRSALHRSFAAVALMAAVLTVPPAFAEPPQGHASQTLAIEGASTVEHVTMAGQGVTEPVAAIEHPLNLERIRGQAKSLIPWSIQTAWCSLQPSVRPASLGSPDRASTLPPAWQSFPLLS